MSFFHGRKIILKCIGQDAMKGKLKNDHLFEFVVPIQICIILPNCLPKRSNNFRLFQICLINSIIYSHLNFWTIIVIKKLIGYALHCMLKSFNNLHQLDFLFLLLKMLCYLEIWWKAINVLDHVTWKLFNHEVWGFFNGLI